MTSYIPLGKNGWFGFDGLYSYGILDSDDSEYVYIIGGKVYFATTLELTTMSARQVILQTDLQPTLDIDPDGSEILAISISPGDQMYYQQLSTGQFIELIPRPNIGYEQLLDVSILQVPLPGGVLVEGTHGPQFQHLPLKPLDTIIVTQLTKLFGFNEFTYETFDMVLESLNGYL